MVKKSYIPNKGDLLWINFNPQRGREQKGKRPALVISPKVYNSKTGLALMCPITSQEKGYPFEVPIENTKIKGFILADQIRTLDWETRKISFISKTKKEVLLEVQEKLSTLITSD